MLKKLIILTSMALAVTAASADEAEKVDLTPHFHGAIRGRWEVDTDQGSGDQRFEVRNARVAMDGKVAPGIDYLIQADMCDQGKMKILDAWGRFRIVDGLLFRAGQFRMPFGVEPFRSPANYVFANRSFMGKQIMNYRAVGAELSYAVPGTGLTVSGGAFNPKAIGDHTPWNRTVAYAMKALWKTGQWQFSGSYGSIRPNDLRANLYDFAAIWDNKTNMTVQAEYMHKHYCNKAANGADSWLVWADWHKPVKWGVFNRWSVQARYDGMTSHYKMDASGFDAPCNRVTVGSTVTYAYKAVHADVRLNYEQYFFHSGYTPAVGAGNKLVAELVIRF